MTRLNQALCISAATIALTAGTALAVESAPNKLVCEGFTSQVTGKKHQWVTTCDNGKKEVSNVLSDTWDSNPNKFEKLIDSINTTAGKNALAAHQNKLALAFGLKENTVFATQMYTINTASGERVDLAMSAALDKATTPVPTVMPIVVTPTTAPAPAGGVAWTDPANGGTYTVYAPIPTAKPVTVTPTTAPTGVVLLPKDPIPTAKPVNSAPTGVAHLPKDPHPTTAPVPTSTIPTSKPVPASTSTTNPNINPKTGCTWGMVSIGNGMCGTVKTNPVPTPVPTTAPTPAPTTAPSPTPLSCDAPFVDVGGVCKMPLGGDAIPAPSPTTPTPAPNCPQSISYSCVITSATMDSVRYECTTVSKYDDLYYFSLPRYFTESQEREAIKAHFASNPGTPVSKSFPESCCGGPIRLHYTVPIYEDDDNEVESINVHVDGTAHCPWKQ